MNAEVLGSYWTTAGPVEIHHGREWSLYDWPLRCAEASRVGFSGLGLWHADLEHLLGRYTLADLKRVFRDHGLEYLELEFLGDWFLEKGSTARRASDSRRKLLFDAAAELGVHHVKVGNIFGRPCERNRLVDEFGSLCADAARNHHAPILYELMPPDVNANSLDSVLEVVEGAGADNGGLVLDFWHLGKLAIAPDRLRDIPPRYLRYVELSDGMLTDMTDPVEETTKYRCLPGEGQFDVLGYVSVLRDLGYDGPWGVEVLSEQLRTLPVSEIFDRTAESARESLGEVPQ